MAHWIVYTVRGWIAFLAFMNVGTAVRCFTDENFLRTKFFGIDTVPSYHKDGPEMERMFAFWSICNGILFSHCAVFIQDTRILGLSICSLCVYLAYFLAEVFVYGTIFLKGAVLFPIFMAGMSLLWLTVGYKFLWQADFEDDIDENELLRKGFPFRPCNRKLKYF